MYRHTGGLKNRETFSVPDGLGAHSPARVSICFKRSKNNVLSLGCEASAAPLYWIFSGGKRRCPGRMRSAKVTNSTRTPACFVMTSAKFTELCGRALELSQCTMFAPSCRIYPQNVVQVLTCCHSCQVHLIKVSGSRPDMRFPRLDNRSKMQPQSPFLWGSWHLNAFDVLNCQAARQRPLHAFPGPISLAIVITLDLVQYMFTREPTSASLCLPSV